MGELRPGNTVSLPPALFDVSEWHSCYCCGRSYLAVTMVRFDRHPEDAVCVRCVVRLHDCSRPIIRKLYPTWQLPAFVRAWLTTVIPAAGSAAAREKAGSSPQLSPPQAG